MGEVRRGSSSSELLNVIFPGPKILNFLRRSERQIKVVSPGKSKRTGWGVQRLLVSLPALGTSKSWRKSFLTIFTWRCPATRVKWEQSLSLVFSMQSGKKQKQWSLKEPTDLCRLVEIILKVLVLLYLSIYFSCRAKTGGSRSSSVATSSWTKPTVCCRMTSWHSFARSQWWQTQSTSPDSQTQCSSKCQTVDSQMTLDNCKYLLSLSTEALHSLSRIIFSVLSFMNASMSSRNAQFNDKNNLK